MSPELETLDQLQGGDLLLSVIRGLFLDHDSFVRGVAGVLDFLIRIALKAARMGNAGPRALIRIAKMHAGTEARASRSQSMLRNPT